jgi:autotransporter-associated beta strand protein
MNPAGIIFTGNLSGFTGYFEAYTDGGIAGAGATFATAQSFPVNASRLAWSSWGLTSARTQTFKYTGSGSVTTSAPMYMWIGYSGSTALLDHSGISNATLTLNGGIANESSTSTTLQINVASTAGALTLGGNITQTALSTTTINKTGTGVAVLSGSNTHTGGSRVTTGKLVAAKKTALGTGPVIVSGSLQCTDTTTDTAKLASVSSFTSSGGRLILGA